jgi:hypothetical protein
MTAKRAGIEEPVEPHTSAAMNQHATIEEPLEMVFSVLSVLRLYSKGHQEK